jgi:hypothetical protein
MSWSLSTSHGINVATHPLNIHSLELSGFWDAESCRARARKFRSFDPFPIRRQTMNRGHRHVCRHAQPHFFEFWIYFRLESWMCRWRLPGNRQPVVFSNTIWIAFFKHLNYQSLTQVPPLSCLWWANFGKTARTVLATVNHPQPMCMCACACVRARVRCALSEERVLWWRGGSWETVGGEKKYGEVGYCTSFFQPDSMDAFQDHLLSARDTAQRRIWTGNHSLTSSPLQPITLWLHLNHLY